MVCGTADDRSAGSAAVQRADLIAERIAQVGEIKLACGTLAPVDAGVVEGLDLLGAVASEADGAAVGASKAEAQTIGRESSPPWVSWDVRKPLMARTTRSGSA